MSYYTPSRAHSHRSHSRSHSHSYPASPYYDPNMNNGYQQQYQTPGTPYYPGTQPSMGVPMPQPTVYQNGYGGVAQTQPTVVYTPSSHRSHSRRHGRRHSSRHHRHHSEPVVMNVPTGGVSPTIITVRLSAFQPRSVTDPTRHRRALTARDAPTRGTAGTIPISRSSSRRRSMVVPSSTIGRTHSGSGSSASSASGTRPG